MKSLAFLLLFTHLSTQLPYSQDSPTQLRARDHPFSPHSSNLKRVAHSPLSHGRRKRQWTDWSSWGGGPPSPATFESGSIIDNEKVKYLIPVTIGSQTLNLEIDTGSADTWAIRTGYKCYRTFNKTTQVFIDQLPYSHCNFGTPFTPDQSFVPIPATDFYEETCYGQTGEGDNRCVRGEFGKVPVNLLGLQIPEQAVGAPVLSSQVASGANISSGILGMGYPASTSAFNGTSGNQTHYSSIMNTLFNVDTFNPPLRKQFSVGLSRDISNSGNGGIFTIGGLPSLSDPAVNVSLHVPPAYAPFLLHPTTFYTIAADNFIIGSKSMAHNTSIIIDSGAGAFQLPSKAAVDTINSLWSPPGKGPLDNLTLSCNAVLTEPVGVTIAGRTFFVKSGDLLLDAGDGTCGSLVSQCVAGECLVGDPLLKNTLAVFDWEKERLGFWAREEYVS